MTAAAAISGTVHGDVGVRFEPRFVKIHQLRTFRLSQFAVLNPLRNLPAKAIVHSAYSDPRAAQWLAERAKIPAVVLPFTIGGSERAQDLFGLFDDTLARLLAVAP